MRKPKRGRCISHFYLYNYLEEQILEKIDESVSNFIKELDIEELNNEVVRTIHKETQCVDKRISDLNKDKKQILSRLSTLYNDRCEGVITGELYKELSLESEKKLKKINDSINNEEIKKLNIKNKVTVLPNYTKKIKELLDLKKPKKTLIDTLIDTIVIDERRNICIKFKYDVIPMISFKYENRNLARNSYPRK